MFPAGSSVSDVTRLKLAVFDVRDREKEEVSENDWDDLTFIAW